MLLLDVCLIILCFFSFSYWFLGPLKHRFTYLWTTVRRWPATLTGTIEYAEARDTDLPVRKTGVLEKEMMLQQQERQKASWMSFVLSLFVSRNMKRPSKRQNKSSLYIYRNHPVFPYDLYSSYIVFVIIAWSIFD